jgi:hypothetical protein
MRDTAAAHEIGSMRQYRRGSICRASYYLMLPQALGYPCTCGGRLEEDTSLRVLNKNRRKALPLGVEPLIEFLSGF